MPSWILPSDTHNVGDIGHTTDHNHIVDDLTLINDALPVVSGSNGQVFPGWLAPTVVNLTFVPSGTTTVNTTLGNAFNLTLTASTTTLGNPANPVEGQVIRFRITQGGGGGFTLNYAGAYDFGTAGAPAFPPPQEPSTSSVLNLWHPSAAGATSEAPSGIYPPSLFPAALSGRLFSCAKEPDVCVQQPD